MYSMWFSLFTDTGLFLDSCVHLLWMMASNLLRRKNWTATEPTVFLLDVFDIHNTYVYIYMYTIVSFGHDVSQGWFHPVKKPRKNRGSHDKMTSSGHGQSFAPLRCGPGGRIWGAHAARGCTHESRFDPRGVSNGYPGKVTLCYGSHGSHGLFYRWFTFDSPNSVATLKGFLR